MVSCKATASEHLWTILRTEYFEDKHQLARLSARIDEVAPVLGKGFHVGDRAWPYELQRDLELKIGHYSFKTNAMILFAMAVVSNRVERSVLAPAFRPRIRNVGDNRFAAALNGGWERLGVSRV